MAVARARPPRKRAPSNHGMRGSRATAMAYRTAPTPSAPLFYVVSLPQIRGPVPLQCGRASAQEASPSTGKFQTHCVSSGPRLAALTFACRLSVPWTGAETICKISSLESKRTSRIEDWSHRGLWFQVRWRSVWSSGDCRVIQWGPQPRISPPLAERRPAKIFLPLRLRTRPQGLDSGDTNPQRTLSNPAADPAWAETAERWRTGRKHNMTGWWAISRHL